MIVRKILLSIVLIQLFNCKTDPNSKKKSDLIIDKDSNQVKTLNTNIKYVMARSGLNYRNKPKGEIIGKFEFGEEVKIVDSTNVFQSIIDEDQQINGEWLGVKSQNTPEINYVFSAFLADKKEFELISNNFLHLIPLGYEVEYKAEGDLNGDKKNDIVAVVKRKINFKGDREVYVFLKDKKSFKIDKISKTAFPNKFYSEVDMDMYSIENITIVNNALIIELYGTGPVGNNISKFKYFDNKLLLTSIEVYANGAGGNYKSNYDVLNGKIITETTNLMKEEAPTETTIKKVEIKEYKFENCNPRNIDF